MIRIRWFLVVLVRFAEDELVVAQAEGVAVDGDWIKVDVRVGAFGLTGGAAIEVPNWQI